MIPDTHGAYAALSELLVRAGVTNHLGNRTDHNAHVIHLGDLANCVRDSVGGDQNCLNLVGDSIDTLLCGNHEHPYLGGPAFSGYEFDWGVHQKINEVVADGISGRMLPCYAVDDILITHAGIGPGHWQMIGAPKSASAAASDIVNLWRENPTHRLFSDIGYRRGGYGSEGGILWRDFKEPLVSDPFRQLFGHSVGEKVRSGGGAYKVGDSDPGITREPKPRWWCIDVGMGKHSDKLVWAEIEDGEVTIREHVRS